MLTFAAAVFFLIVTPGPGVLSTAGVGSGFGWRAGLSYLFGLWVGNNLVAFAVISGAAAVVLASPVLKTVLFWASVAYLLYLASKIALAGSRVAFVAAERAPGPWDALALQAINPKAYAVHTAFFTGFAVWDGAAGETLAKVLVMNAIWIPIHLAWLGLGVGLRRLDPPPRVQRAINVAMALAMLAVVALAAVAGS